jgi:hypothetical protein
MLRDICQRLGIEPDQLTVHSDNGSPMKGETMLATMQRLGAWHISPSAQIRLNLNVTLPQRR